MKFFDGDLSDKMVDILENEEQIQTKTVTSDKSKRAGLTTASIEK